MFKVLGWNEIGLILGKTIVGVVYSFYLFVKAIITLFQELDLA
jgi:hypothetical protein